MLGCTDVWVGYGYTVVVRNLAAVAAEIGAAAVAASTEKWARCVRISDLLRGYCTQFR